MHVTSGTRCLSTTRASPDTSRPPMLLENGAICSEHTFDGNRCHYAALNLKVQKLLQAFEARPPPLNPLQAAMREIFLGCGANRDAHIEI
ncbi:hypothetical protein C1H46_021149 [Malus baccata]|uniref:Uncharacterized protein n=1 Tax=Malus baccata TaxID=106549 RepID=A0A540M3C4_MALBA|nr:hypothetical protein C1H46_021149 [Malus baccata]